jgi:hypothetical protein
MGNEYLLGVIASALDLIHKEMLMRNAYDVGLITKEHYQDYLKTMLYIPEKNKESEE